MTEHQHKKKHTRGEIRKKPQYEFRNATCVCRDDGRKAKTHLELMLARNLNANKNFYCCVSKTLNKKNVGLG